MGSILDINDIFKNPQFYRDKFLSSSLISGNTSQFTGKSFICVSLTRFCPVGCKFCFFKSGPVFKKTSLEDHMTEEGTGKFIKFANQVNLGYLLVSGGGEPMMEKKSILRIIEQVISERIVLVTSAHWAKNYDSAKKYIDSIVQAIEKRNTETSVTIRVSVDVEHCSIITLSPIVNLIKIFYENNFNFIDLQVHSVEGDQTIDKLVDILKHNYVNIEKIVLTKKEYLMVKVLLK